MAWRFGPGTWGSCTETYLRRACEGWSDPERVVGCYERHRSRSETSGGAAGSILGPATTYSGAGRVPFAREHSAQTNRATSARTDIAGAEGGHEHFQGLAFETLNLPAQPRVVAASKYQFAERSSGFTSRI